MDNAVKNLPQVYYGMHFQPGVAEYKINGEAKRVYINEATAKKMDPTMAGKPLVVEHIDGALPETLDGIKAIADGYVSESFYNPADGCHWAKFIVVTDKAKAAIASGWKLSNAYKPTEMGVGGKHVAVDYDQEILNGEYEHLAIVQQPRYEKSQILSPEQFKQYCLEKKTELARLANSKDTPKQGAKSVLNIFKRTKVENSADFDEMVVRLPKSGKEFTLTNLVNEMDAIQNMNGYANPDHMVKVGNEEMSVKEMADCYGKMKSEMDEMKKNAEMSEEEKKKKEEEEKKKNAEKEMHEPKPDKEVKEVEAEERKMNQAEYERIKNKADLSFPIQNEDSPVVLPNHGVRKGMAAYGAPVSQFQQPKLG